MSDLRKPLLPGAWRGRPGIGDSIRRRAGEPGLPAPTRTRVQASFDISPSFL
jgi:hypothetical protein